MSEPEVTGNPLERQKMTTTLWSFFESGSKDYNEAKSKTKGKIMYKFSVPMPYTKDDINKLLNINNNIEKSKITSLYFSLPVTNELFTGFEQHRNFVNKEWDYWKNLIEHSLNKGQDFIYLLNNPARLQIENENFERQMEKLDKLLIELQKIGCNKLRIAEHKLMSHIEQNYPYFNLYASTSFEMKSLSEYRNFMIMHPSVKQIVPSHDNIKNFTLLKNLKKMLPNTEIELMVNEGCANGCPNRNGHAEEIMDRHIMYNNSIILSNFYFKKTFCIKLTPLCKLLNSNVIYPWEIEEYAKLGIKNFKLVGRDSFSKFDNYLKSYKMYLKGIDDIKSIKNEYINTFIHHLADNDIFKNFTVNEIKKYLPDIRYFKKYGYLCSSRCGVECNYCYKYAEKIKKIYIKKQEAAQKRSIPVCVINKAGI